MAIPASITTVARDQPLAPGSAARPASIFCSVVASLTLAANIRPRLGKPLTSSTNPKLTKGQSLRFSLDRPRLAWSIPAATPSKYVWVRSYTP